MSCLHTHLEDVDINFWRGGCGCNVNVRYLVDAGVFRIFAILYAKSVRLTTMVTQGVIGSQFIFFSFSLYTFTTYSWCVAWTWVSPFITSQIHRDCLVAPCHLFSYVLIYVNVYHHNHGWGYWLDKTMNPKSFHLTS